jgi:hypothetical protein
MDSTDPSDQRLSTEPVDLYERIDRSSLMTASLGRPSPRGRAAVSQEWRWNCPDTGVISG